MVECVLAQVVLDPLTKYTGQINETKDVNNLHDSEQGIGPNDLKKGDTIAGEDALIDDLFSEECEVGIESRNDPDCNDESDQPGPVGFS